MWRAGVVVLLCLATGACASSDQRASAQEAASDSNERPYVEHQPRSYSFEGVLDYDYYIPKPDTADLSELTEPPGVTYVKQSTPDLKFAQVDGGMTRLQTVANRVLSDFTCPVRGRVFVTALIDKTGRANAPQVVRGIHPECDEKALDVLRSLEFESAELRGEPIAMPISFPITFQ